MKAFKDPRLILGLIISLTLFSAELNDLYPTTLQDRLKQGKTINLLLIGIDARPGEIQTRSDTLILVSLRESLRKVVMISIPRDTRIVFNGSNTKINMINQRQGPQAMCREVGKLMNTDVPYYAVTNFKGFEDIIDTLGGVSMDVDIRLQSYSSGVFLEKGYQQLTGKEALAYVRFRSNPDMDIGRTKRQQKLMAALARQVMQKETISLLPQLIPKVRQSVTSNISAGEMLILTRMALEFDQGGIITQTLPGYHYRAPDTGASYWEADRGISKSLLDGLFQGKQYETNLPAPPGVNSWQEGNFTGS